MLEYFPAGRSDNTKALHFLPAITLSVAAVFIAVAIKPARAPKPPPPPLTLVSTLITPSLWYNV